MLAIIKKDFAQEIKKRRLDFSWNNPAETTVRQIIEAVAQKGDEAVLDYTAHFDGLKLKPEQITITGVTLEKASHLVGQEFIKAIRVAIKNISDYHLNQMPRSWEISKPYGVKLGWLWNPIKRVGVYIPGGAAAYPSSVLMNVIPAKLAGVEEIYLVSPPSIKESAIPGCHVSPYTLAAAWEVGINKVFQIGGAQAIAALALGTKTIPAVDKITGPGNLYVTLAKKNVSGLVGIDGLAGPSEVCVLADNTADPEYIACDLLAQAEHDASARVYLITTSGKLAEQVDRFLEKLYAGLPRREIISRSLSQGAVFLTKTLAQSIDLANALAPEHLVLMTHQPEEVMDKITNAGAIFLGKSTPVTVGDYLAGPNHTLPTGGSARFASPLNILDFVKGTSFIKYSQKSLHLTDHELRILTAAEGLDAHYLAVRARLKKGRD